MIRRLKAVMDSYRVQSTEYMGFGALGLCPQQKGEGRRQGGHALPVALSHSAGNKIRYGILPITAYVIQPLAL
jgi:hypothetical protein